MGPGAVDDGEEEGEENVEGEAAAVLALASTTALLADKTIAAVLLFVPPPRPLPAPPSLRQEENLSPCKIGPEGTSISPRDLPACVTDAAERGRHARDDDAAERSTTATRRKSFLVVVVFVGVVFVAVVFCCLCRRRRRQIVGALRAIVDTILSPSFRQ